MTDVRSRHLGSCPNCRQRIATSTRVIEYETERGWWLVIAECPTCSAVVNPT